MADKTVVMHSVDDLVFYKDKLARVMEVDFRYRLDCGEKWCWVSAEELDKYNVQVNVDLPYVSDESGNELNLVELLENHIGEKFYVTLVGADLELLKITGDTLMFCGTDFVCRGDGRRYNGGAVLVYPSKESYMKYPLNPYRAWMEWKIKL